MASIASQLRRHPPCGRLPREIARIRFGLRLQNAVDGGDQFDELVDRPVALLRRQFSVIADPLQLVEDRVLALFPPVKQEHVLEQLRKAGIISMLWR